MQQISSEASHPSLNEPSAVELTHRDFTFVDYRNPVRFFQKERPFRFYQTSPSVEILSNAIYTPATYKPYDGCLYDAERQRLDQTCIVRGVTDTFVTTDGPHFDGNPGALDTYEQPVLYIGHMMSHYGHFLLETLGAWWPTLEDWDGVDRYLIHLHDPKALDKPHVKACLAALGIARERIAFFDKPTKLKQVIVPRSSFQIHSHIYTKYRALCETLVTNMGGKTARTTEQPLFVSRRLLDAGIKTYSGEEKIEEYLASRGVRVVHPQLLPFEEQIQLYNEHKVIFGLIGSALLNIAFSLEPKTLVTLTHPYVAPNYFLIDKAFDADTTFLQACSNSDRVQWMINLALQKLKLKGRKDERSFHRTYALDTGRVIKWFAQSGYC